MQVFRTKARASSARAAGVGEFDRVRLKTDTQAEGYLLPKGAEGTVVLVHGEGEAFEVEFTAPFHAVIGVPASLLASI